MSSPFLFDSDLTVIQNHPHLKTATIKARYTNGAGGLKAGLDKLCQECAEAVQKGSECIVITDKPDEGPDSPAIPSLLAVGAVHHHLIKVGLRSKASIVVESASAFSTHHFAVLIGYGASLCARGWLWKLRESGELPPRLKNRWAPVNFHSCRSRTFKET